MNAKSAVVALSALGIGLAVLSTGNAWAGAKIVDPSGNTTATRVPGAVESNPSSNRDPWVAQVFSSGGECLRIFVVSQATDLEATLVSPSGRVWQDDDSGGSLRPLIKAITDVRGWYPLVFYHFSGASVNADFTVDITRLPTSSTLCSPATTPRITAPLKPTTPIQPPPDDEPDPDFGEGGSNSD